MKQTNQHQLIQRLNEVTCPILMDGAMGTYFHKLTGQPADACEESNLQAPELITSIHRSYLEVGSRVLRTNTYAWLDYLSRYDREQTDTMIRAAYGAARLALAEFKAEQKSVAQTATVPDTDTDMFFILADLGFLPDTFGEEVFGEFKHTIDTWMDLGATHFICETLRDDRYLLDVACYIKEKLPETCVMASFAIPPDGITAAGEPIDILFSRLDEMPELDILGLNCVSGPVPTTRLLSRIGPLKKKLSVCPNAGYPTVIDRQMVFPTSPAYFGEQMRSILRLGANLVGGCCGTTPFHIKELAKVVADDCVTAGKRSMSQRVATEVTTKESSIESEAGQSVVPVVKTADEIPVVTAVETGEESPSAHAHNPILQRMTQGQRLIAVEYDSPATPDIQPYYDGALAIEEAGADALTIADCPVARPRGDSSLTAAALKQVLTHCEPIPHLTCRDRNANATKAILLGLNMLEIFNVLIVTGDPIPQEDRDDIKGVFNFNSVVLGEYIRTLNETLFAKPFNVAGAFNINALKLEYELERARRKIEVGVKTLFTQPVMSERGVERMAQMREELPEAYIMGGIMPIVSHRNALYMQNELSGMYIDDDIVARYEGKNRDQGEAVALDITVRLAEQISPYIDGFYLITPFNRVDLICRILSEIKNL
ncbi:MAG TPA: bifunctional homocysteine S-methyltransferase/methylenetetrahydrofolate reductase [Clostridiaceae bacterium]|nr:bifunctional homocysteine S-methyltransferase/methylenetetrahydrofolate reductase [Clostridiaceae bacterium]